MDAGLEYAIFGTIFFGVIALVLSLISEWLFKQEKLRRKLSSPAFVLGAMAIGFALLGLFLGLIKSIPL